MVPLVTAGRPFPRKHAKCAFCGSLERHRFLFYVYQIEVLSRGGKQKILHLAPEAAISNLFRNTPGVEYLSGDIAPEDYRREIPECAKINVLAMDFPDGTFDTVIANHLIEHVDEEAFLKEIRRVLKDDGVALISTSVYMDLEKTLENPEYNTPALRLKFYGHSGHLRKYGRDAAERFSRLFDVRFISSSAIPPFGDPVNSNCFLLRKRRTPPENG